MTPHQLLEALQRELQGDGISSFISAAPPPGLHVDHAGHSVRVNVGSTDPGHESFVWTDEVDDYHHESPAGTLAWLRWWATSNAQGAAIDPEGEQRLPVRPTGQEREPRELMHYHGARKNPIASKPLRKVTSSPMVGGRERWPSPWMSSRRVWEVTGVVPTALRTAARLTTSVGKSAREE